MEDLETNILQTRKGHRIEQMVVRWLRRSRDNTSCRNSTGDSPIAIRNQSSCSLKITVVIEKDLLLGNYGFDISRNPPLTVTAVTTGSPAEGKILPGDQILRINGENVENMPAEQAANIVRESVDSITMTVLRNTSSPKSSFLTAEKRARLRSNPVKVRFAEEVIVNGHTQGNSLLFMPNVLKVYLENGQTKAFKFEKKTTVKDIILTLKEKLSINSIEHFALALEEQYNISKVFLLHEDELIEQVVQKKESHDYRCLFRVCFVPKDPLNLLQEDPVAFEYLYLQSCSDVLHERFAVEMKCSVALRLAALHIQERIHTCGQPQKISFKYIEKDWGIDNFLSPTLLRSMRGKDIKKAISFHMKRNQCILEPRQKQPVSSSQVRLNYLRILGDLKTYGGKIFSATLMLQDRESYVTLLVGAKYGISQIINNKLNIMTCLAEFSNISRIELNPESEKVSMVKVYLQDVKPLTLLLESHNAKDIACLISGYCKLFVDSSTIIFRWPGSSQLHRVSAEEGYESRVCSDSDESSDFDSSLELSSDLHILKYHGIKPLHEEEEDVEEDEEERENVKEYKEDREIDSCDVGERGCCDGGNNDTDSISEASDSADTESQGYKISWSSDSIDALEEDDLETCSSSRPEFFQFFTPSFKDMAIDNNGVFNGCSEVKVSSDGSIESDPLLCFLQLSNSRADSEADTKERSGSPRGTEYQEDNVLQGISVGCQLIENSSMEYYSLCSNVSPASSVDKYIASSPESNSVRDQTAEAKRRMYILGLNNEVETLILDPPPGFGDSSSEEEFFDATDRFTPTQTSPGSKSNLEESKFPYPDNVGFKNSKAPEKLKKKLFSKKADKVLRKRRSFLQTDYTSQVTFPLSPSSSLETMDHVCCYEKESHVSIESHSPTVSSLKDTEGEPALLETKSLAQHKSTAKTKNRTHSPNLMEMEPDTMEIKSVTDSVVSSISAFRYRYDENMDEIKQSEKLYSLYSCNEEHSPTENTMEGNDRASPSQISIQMDKINISGQNDLCLERFSFDTSTSKGFLYSREGFESEITTTFKNIFEDGDQQEGQDKNCSLEPYIDPIGRQSLYIAKLENKLVSPIPTEHKSETNGLKVHQNNKANDESDFQPQNTETQNAFQATSVLSDLSNRHKSAFCEVGQLNGRESSPTFTEAPTMENIYIPGNCSVLLMPPCTSPGKQNSLKLCYDEDEEQHGNFSQKSEKTRTAKKSNLPISKSSATDFQHNDYLSYDSSFVENGCHERENSEKRPVVPKVGNCSCQLSYTSCFRGGETETDDETITNGVTVSELPRTRPPASYNVQFVEGDSTRNSTVYSEQREAFNHLKDRVYDALTGFDKLQDSVLDLQKILEENQNNTGVHSIDNCEAIFTEQKSSLCSVSRNLVSVSQKVLRLDQSSVEMCKVMTETFFSLLQMTEMCLQFSRCNQCDKRQNDVQSNLRDLICTYRQFVQAAKQAVQCDTQDLHLKLLSRQCTSLTAAVFCLTQQFRTVISP
ncbi:FERM and PDZ domain-containing protein 1 isoform X2 [Xenopus laevis]|uniref:FERM and PDZ domain-containing protein 1 isoform X2 n=1 Tax=Xenopus laevis TaxID=8355 RepID=A0A8J0UXQ9_XENLA|nr:FERM and PDZ domain-containing protein 1 isoform X2 [Xenopus laevis]